MTLELGQVEVDVGGQVIEFDMFNNNVEYEIDSTHLPNVSISECVRSLRRHSRSLTARERPKIELVVRLAEKAFWEYSVYCIYITDKRSYLDLQFVANASIGMQQEDVQEIVSSHIQGTDFTVLKVWHDNSEHPLIESDGWRGWVVELRLKLKSENTFEQLLRLRSRISQEIFLPSEKLTTPYLILRAIQSGRTDVLLGKAESEFLEVKSAAYDLKDVEEARWKLELAQDVAQFANSPAGGILLIGYRTRKINGIDIIQKVTPVQPRLTRLQSYGDVLKSRVHPPISGIQIGSIPVGGNEIIYFYIPAQPEENKPYVISGAVIDDFCISTGISIVRRQGDACIPVTAEEIHAALVIGRALIRGNGNSK